MENELGAEQEEDADHFFSDLMPIVVSKIDTPTSHYSFLCYSFLALF